MQSALVRYRALRRMSRGFKRDQIPTDDANQFAMLAKAVV